MTWRSLICILLPAVMLTAACSTHKSGPEREAEGHGSLTLSFCPGLPDTKAETAQEGYAFKNLLVVLADHANKVIDREYKVYDAPVTRDVITFEDIIVGAYHIYAYANITHLDWQQAQTIEEVENQLAKDPLGGGALDPYRQMKTLTGTEVPADPAKLATPIPMLLTGHKQMSVGISENLVEVELLRPVTKLNIYLHNHTAFDITLKSLSFSDFNASDSYLLSHIGNDGRPELPAGNTYRPLPPYDDTHPCVVAPAVPGDPESGKMLVYSNLLYENSYNREYRMFANIEMDFVNDMNEHSTLSKALTQKGVRLVPYSELAALSNGSSMEVMLVNPNTKTGYFYGYTGNTLVYSVANYNFQESFMSKAVDLLNNDQIGNYYRFTLNKLEDGKVTLKVGSKNIFDGAPGKSVIMEEGFVPTYLDYPVSKEFADYLVRFKTTANKYFYNGNKNVNYSSSNTDRGNYMWALYEVNPLGSAMRLVDNETAQVTPLTCMRRNQELNVVMNVYFETVERRFEFVVDNAYWTEGHKSSHMYK